MAYDPTLESDAERREQDFLYRLGYMQRRPLPQKTLNGIACAMQKNPFLSVPRFPEDPAFEREYSLSLFDTDDVTFLADYFAHGNWAYREGVVFGDLAFVQQVNGGDEWAIFKHDDGGITRRDSWTCYDMPFGSFESVGFGAIVREDGLTKLQHILALMQMATQDECARLDYDDGHVAAVRWEVAHVRINTTRGERSRVWSGHDLEGNVMVEVVEQRDGSATLQLQPRGSIDKEHFDGLMEARDLAFWGGFVAGSEGCEEPYDDYRFSVLLDSPLAAARYAQAIVSHAALYGRDESTNSTLSVAVDDAQRIVSLLKRAGLEPTVLPHQEDVVRRLVTRTLIGDLLDDPRIAGSYLRAPSDRMEVQKLTKVLSDWQRGRREAADRGERLTWNADLTERPHRDEVVVR